MEICDNCLLGRPVGSPFRTLGEYKDSILSCLTHYPREYFQDPIGILLQRPRPVNERCPNFTNGFSKDTIADFL
jgi:hypothetical protein